MTEAEKESAVKLVKALNVLPEIKKEYILGFADGMAHALNKEEVIESECDSRQQNGDSTPE